MKIVFVRMCFMFILITGLIHMKQVHKERNRMLWPRVQLAAGY